MHKYVSVDVEKNDNMLDDAKTDLEKILCKIDEIHEELNQFYKKYSTMIGQVGNNIKYTEFCQKISVIVKPKLEKLDELHDRLVIISLKIEEASKTEGNADDIDNN